jgi:hypothetical protein
MDIGGFTFAPGDVGVVSLLLTMFTLLVTDTIVTGRRLKKAEARADRLEEKVWSLMETAKVAVTAAEVSSEAISRLPQVIQPDEGEGKT